MLAFDPGQNRGDVAILAIKSEPALPVVPGKSRETSLDRGDRKGRGLPGWCSQISHIKSNHLRRGGQRFSAFQPAPAGEVFPVGGVGLVRVPSRRGLGVVPGGIDQPVERAGADHMGGQSD